MSQDFNKKTDWRKLIVGIIGLIVIGLGYLKSGNLTGITPKEPSRQEEVTPKPVTDDTDPGDQRLTYFGKELIYTKHAKCRMDCRQISEKEVGEILKNGVENRRKSNPNDPRCPTIALEAETSDGQTVRAIIANCEEVAKLVTVIDLDNEWRCTCD